MSVGLPKWSHLLLTAAMNSKAGLMTGKICQKDLSAALSWGGMLSTSLVNAWRVYNLNSVAGIDFGIAIIVGKVLFAVFIGRLPLCCASQK